MRIRDVVVGLGVAFTGLGVAVAVSPAVADVVRLPDVPTVVVGAFAALLAVTAAIDRRQTSYRDAEEAARGNDLLEGRYEPDRPGSDIDEALRSVGSPAEDAPEDRLRERLRVVAARVIEDAEGCSREAAHRRLDEGTWTDDQTAASYFADEEPPAKNDLLGSVLGFETTDERQARHALAELRELAGVDVGGESDADA